ncbi:MAG: hypothetical protein UR82_C0072G0007, partial [Candidatus Moranbacteria bacterium GW2011_GWF1_35_5]
MKNKNQQEEIKNDNLKPIKIKIKSNLPANKPKIAIVALTSCEGCQFALLDLGEKFLELVEKVEMIDWG